MFVANYALTKAEPIDPVLLDEQLKAANPKIKGTSVVHYTQPRVILLHCEQDQLTDAELAELSQIVAQHIAATP